MTPCSKALILGGIALLLASTPIFAKTTDFYVGICRNATYDMDGHLELSIKEDSGHIEGYMSISGELEGSGELKGKREGDQILFETTDETHGIPIQWKGTIREDRISGEYVVPPLPHLGFPKRQKGEWEVELSQLLPEEVDASGKYVFPLSGLSVPKRLNELELVDVQEYAPDGSNTQITFYEPETALRISLYVYKSPSGAYGPTFVLDSEGKKIVEDREEVIREHNGIFKLTAPSEHYQQEYSRTLESISSQGYQVESEFRFLAVPARSDSPIAYAARLSGNRELQSGELIPWAWNTYLYTIPGFFVKIHCTYPSHMSVELEASEVEFIQAINWGEVL